MHQNVNIKIRDQRRKYSQRAVRGIHEKTHEKEAADEKQGFCADSPLLRDKADEGEYEECWDEGSHGHDEHPSCAEPPHKLGKEKNLERASTCPIESHDVPNACRVKAQASHGDGNVKEEWNKSVY